jgi:hypothetical protein
VPFSSFHIPIPVAAAFGIPATPAQLAVRIANRQSLRKCCNENVDTTLAAIEKPAGHGIVPAPKIFRYHLLVAHFVLATGVQHEANRSADRGRLGMVRKRLILVPGTHPHQRG